MINQKDIERLTKDSEGNCFSLKVGPTCKNVSAENFMPDNSEYADAERYLIYSYDKLTDMNEAPIIEDIELAQSVVKRLKEIHGIKDPWDDDPDYFKRKFKAKKEKLEKKAEPYLKDSKGSYHVIKISPEYIPLDGEDVLPDNLRYPDACVYEIYSSGKDGKALEIEDLELKDTVVKMLKDIHGIKDHWDDGDFDILRERIWQKNQHLYLEK